MGYRIQYTQSLHKEIIAEPGRRKHSTVMIWLITVLCIAVYIMAIQGEDLESFLLPGDPVVTKDAITAFADDVRGGVPVGEAFTDFCAEILENAV